MTKSPVKVLVVACAACLLGACGGGDGGAGPITSIPPPPPAPPPPPPPPPPVTRPPAPAGSIGLVSDDPFAVVGVSFDYTLGGTAQPIVDEPLPAEIQLEYAEAGTYIITLPGFQPGELVTEGYNGSYADSSAWQSIRSTWNSVSGGATGRQDVSVNLSWLGPLNANNDLLYTSWGSWKDNYDVNYIAPFGNFGYFAYGIPTEQAKIPVTGKASYSAQVIGATDYEYPSFAGEVSTDYITGMANLTFDFGAGILDGEMRPLICDWDCYELGVYAFAETVYSVGSASFSGKFSQAGATLPSWFEGSFNGPNAEEIMARWKAPYAFGSVTGTMAGVWVGKADPGPAQGK